MGESRRDVIRWLRSRYGETANFTLCIPKSLELSITIRRALSGGAENLALWVLLHVGIVSQSASVIATGQLVRASHLREPNNKPGCAGFVVCAAGQPASVITSFPR